jgi:hypothetical protein
MNLVKFKGSLRPIVLKNSVLRLPENSCEFLVAGTLNSQMRFQGLRRSWADFHVLSTTPSYLEYEMPLKSQMNSPLFSEQSFSTQ